MTSESKICKGCEGIFTITQADFGFYQNVGTPPPDYCPQCRAQRRLAFRNERTLYRRSCDNCKRDIVAIYPPETPWPVFCATCWWSDSWDAKTYALVYDPHRPFFDQFRELQSRVPRIGLLSINSVNSEYTNNSADNRNCYLLFAAEKCEDSLYGRLVQHCKNVMDVAWVYDSELCYECIDCRQCYQCLFSERCQASSNLLFCFDARDCKDCILSTNIRHQQYCIENEQYSKEEYEKRKEEILSSFSSLEAAKKRFEELKILALVKYAFQTKCVNATGDYLFNCHDTKVLFDASNAKECAYLADAEDAIDCYDGNNMYYKPELCLDLMGILQCYKSRFSTYIFYCNNVEYCDNCHNTSHSIGCIGLKKSQYCILNRPYEPVEYEKLREHIVASLEKEGWYGSFFPPSFSPFGYNETLAADYFPLNQDEAREKGFRWQEQSTGVTGKETLPTAAMPETIEEITDSILKEIFVCAACKKNFRITPAELAFYRRLHLPLPREDFECRHRSRLAKRNPRRLWERTCGCDGLQSSQGSYKNNSSHFHGPVSCPNKFQTSYAPERREVVYCEQCYQSEVV